MADDKRAIFVDTSIFYAFLDRDDQDHQTASDLLEEAREQKITLVTSNFIVAETHALILSRLGHALATRWLRSIPQAARIERVTRADEMRARDIIFRYDDKDFSYADATSFALMERLGLVEAFSLDEHFVQYGRWITWPLHIQRGRRRAR
jgi:predicted nucleic acid-binding protein